MELEPSGWGSKVFKKRGRNKLPGGVLVVAAVNATGEPTLPLSVLGPYKTVLSVVVREHVSIKYRRWISTTNNNENDDTAVPQAVKDLLWRKVNEKFIFPAGCDIEW